MTNFETDYKIWDSQPQTDITDENLLAFIIWSFWISKGQHTHQYKRLSKLKRLDVVREVAKKGVGQTFTDAELVFASQVFNEIRNDKKNRHSVEMTPENAIERLDRTLRQMFYVHESLDFEGDEYE